MRDGVGKEVGWFAVCVKESDRVEKQKCPEKADIYASSLPPCSPLSHKPRSSHTLGPTSFHWLTFFLD